MGTHEEIADVLDGAADVIERDGWHQGDYAPNAEEDGATLSGRPVCALGALHVSSGELLKWSDRVGAWMGNGNDGCECPRVDDAQNVLRAHITRSHVPFWNDAPERTKQEVLDALRLAAKSERRLADGIDL